MVDFTVAIRTYNSEQLLPNMFEKLKEQVDTENITWEIIVIDNNSRDNTAKIVQEYENTNWAKVSSIKYYFEPEQGRAFARHRAIKEAQAELIGFLDDDNLPHPNWVAQAYAFGQSHPNAGAYGGQVYGKFEVPPPQGFEKISRFFALIQGTESYCYNHRYQSVHKRMFPPGAGIVIRKQAWIESVPERPHFTQTCEDIEILFYLWEKCWEIWFNPEMQIDHIISKHRLEKEYLIKFFRENGLCRYQLRMLTYKLWQRPFVIPIYMISDFKKVFSYFLKYREGVIEDPVLAAEKELILSIFWGLFANFGKIIM